MLNALISMQQASFPGHGEIELAGGDLSGPTSSLVTWRPVKSVTCVVCATAGVPRIFAMGKLLPLLYDGVARG